MDVILFKVREDDRIPQVGMVLETHDEGLVVWVALYDLDLGGVRPWGTVCVVPWEEILSEDEASPELAPPSLA